MATRATNPGHLAPDELVWIRHARDNGVGRQCAVCREYHAVGWIGCTRNHAKGRFVCEACRVLVDTGEAKL